MKKLIFVFLLICIIAFTGCSSSESDNVSPPTTSVKIEIFGTVGLEFVGSYGGMSSGGGMTLQSVEDIVPAQYTVKGSGDFIVTCSFIKLEDTGTLVVYIFKNGEIIAQGGTSAAFGMVALTTK